MAFWGVEVKPGKPYTHRYDRNHGSLRIGQATLGNPNVKVRSVVQCNIGNTAPILICSLYPKYAEMCHLDIELEEEVEVIFSVLGQSSVHLSGYYRSAGFRTADDESESYGEDVGKSDTEDNANESEDEYESDFIDDGDDTEIFPSSRPYKSRVVKDIVEDKATNEAASCRHSRRKHQDTDGNDHSDDISQRQSVISHRTSVIVESEDEDNLPICLSLSKPGSARNAEVIANSKQKITDDVKRRKVDATNGDPASVMDLSEPNGSSMPIEMDSKKGGTSKENKKVKDKQVPKSEPKSSADESLSDLQCHNVEGKGIGNANSKGNDPVLMKKKKMAKNAKSSQGSVSFAEQNEVETKQNQNTFANANDTEEHPTESENEQNNDESSGKPKKINKRKILQGDDVHVTEAPPAGAPNKDTNKSNQQSKDVDMASNDNVDVSVGDIKPEVKKKKKKTKSHSKDDIEQDAKNPLEEENRKLCLKMWTPVNGLIIEELIMGNPDAKIASEGTKLSINYTGKLQNGKIFDSNMGQKPYKFRLGSSGVIEGWNIGINGMRVGDQRRLTIPPAMGYGDKAVEGIPKNSWLVYDILLVKVR